MPLVLRQRLKQLELEQRDLATATRVTESYISQLLAGKKAPPAPGRTDIYEAVHAPRQLPLETFGDLRLFELREKLQTLGGFAGINSIAGQGTRLVITVSVEV